MIIKHRNHHSPVEETVKQRDRDNFTCFSVVRSCNFCSEKIFILTGGLIPKPSSACSFSAYSRDIAFPACIHPGMYWYSCSVRKWVKCVQWTTPAECLHGSMVVYAGDRGSNPATRIILVDFFFVFTFFIRPLKSVFRVFSNIKPLRLQFTFIRLFYCEAFTGLSSTRHRSRLYAEKILSSAYAPHLSTTNMQPLHNS